MKGRDHNIMGYVSSSGIFDDSRYWARRGDYFQRQNQSIPLSRQRVQSV